MQTKRKIFKEQGIVILNNVVSNKLVLSINKTVIFWIHRYAKELNCNIGEYLTSVSRWAYPCLMIDNISQSIKTQLINIASEFIGSTVRLHKINIISKSTYADLPIPYHQDISYSRDDPYEFSLWLALQDVNLSDGVLEFLPYSQKDKIEPAVDFWSPNFVDDKYQSAKWQKKFIQVPIKIGDIIAFDSRIWHRSEKNISGKNRFALVTRWSRSNTQLFFDIPKISPAYFGMWTCAKVTKYLLKKGLEKLLQQYLYANDFEKIIKLWQNQLTTQKSLPFNLNLDQAKKALAGVYILHYAATYHNGGDAQGRVYAHLWNSFLSPINNWINTR
ncbi:phytanoyl-CoA dioxygenase family protein [Arsenophonus sp.]|uniref:phytanoyl-CoA dioxygenase family protein n=1 Tax=Arsenophonus sp. TaxID=1872640 RepID=UPI00285BB594|nr:phytanoyl-CoA dioxygenase family protein [Arsenophonus sp.]MDR5617811.1 phytanoyl-CoA dioxygenase family protein [Arsenophonus sp.]MDR5617832.1 phytanoyl-CoA dioxygenase family protein [Arsenophonus sp.]